MYKSVIVILLCVLWGTAFAENITLPHYDNFDTDESYPAWTSSGASHTWLPTGGWNGTGGGKFTLPTATQGYSGVGEYTFNTTTHLNVGMLYYVGNNYFERDTNPGPKWIIAHCNDTNNRVIVQQHGFEGMLGSNRVEVGLGWGIGTVYPSPRWVFTDHKQEWIYYELEIDRAAGYARLFITCQANSSTCSEYNQTLHQQITIPTGVGCNAINIMGGGFGGPSSGANENSYIILDEVRIAASYIGPPSGFRSSGGGGGGGGGSGGGGGGGCSISNDNGSFNTSAAGSILILLILLIILGFLRHIAYRH